MSELDSLQYRQSHRILADNTKRSWDAIVEEGVDPVDKHVFIRAAESKWSEPRNAFTGLFYTLTREAYLEVHHGNEPNLDTARVIFHNAAIAILTTLVEKYDSTTWQAGRNQYLGLINEFTPIALLDGPYADNDSATMLASPNDDRYGKCDLYHLTTTGDYFPIQVKTDNIATVNNIPEQGVIIFGENFLNLSKDISTTRALIKRQQTAEDIHRIQDAAEGLARIIEQRKHLTADQLKEELQRINAKKYTSNHLMFSTIGSIVPELATFREQLAKEQAS